MKTLTWFLFGMLVGAWLIAGIAGLQVRKTAWTGQKLTIVKTDGVYFYPLEVGERDGLIITREWK